MSLHFPIQINGLSIGNVYIRRLHKLTPDQISDYEYEVVLYGSLMSSHKQSWKGNVRHYYGDGALVLIRKVMEDIKPARSSAD